jgi:hypothetical protein
METYIVSHKDRESLRRSREQGLGMMHLEPSEVSRPEKPEAREITAEEKDSLLSLIIHGCPECSCHKDTGAEVLLAKAGIIDMSAIESRRLAEKSSCNCICC